MHDSNGQRLTKDESTTCAEEIGTYVPVIKSWHSDNRQDLIKGLYSLSFSQLVRKFIVEMDAKNTAYFFILENGHFDAFSEYCKKERRTT